MMETRVLEPDMYSTWDEFVLSSPTGTLFHTTIWLKASDLPFRIYALFKGEKIVGGLVVSFKETNWFGRITERPTLTPYTGLVVFAPTSKRTTAYTQFKEIATKIIESVKSDFTEINLRLSPYVYDVQPFIWAGFKTGVRYTYIVEIARLEDTWLNLDENRRRNIKKAEKIGLTICSSLNLLDCISLFRATRSQSDVWEPLVVRYATHLQEHGLAKTIGVRDSDGNLIAAVYIVWDRYRSYYLLGGFNEQVTDRQAGQVAMSFALWDAMCFSRNELGLFEFDLEGSMIPGVELFFRKFGGQLKPFYTISWQKRRLLSYHLWTELIKRAKRMVRYGSGN
ncbi:MAG: GNAT family N-acetyltransferase [Anaerolineae bacterium]|nr:GNAT family N-acetyltransferase [Anaerolineae bacterium]